MGKDRDVPIAVHSDRAFEQGDGLAELPPDIVEIREPQQRLDEAERVLRRLRDPDGFPSVNLTLVKRPTLGQGTRQEGTGQDGGKLGEGEPLTARVVRQQLHQVSGSAFGPPIVARQVVDVETVVPGCTWSGPSPSASPMASARWTDARASVMRPVASM